MSDILVKFAGGQCGISSMGCKSNNPAVLSAMAAITHGFTHPQELLQHAGHAVVEAPAQMVHMAQDFVKSMQHKGK